MAPAREPAEVMDVDVAGWVSWCLAGLWVFSNGGATMGTARREVKRIVVALALFREGSISGAARAVDAPRKSVRQWMRDAGLYPWVDRRSAGR